MAAPPQSLPSPSPDLRREEEKEETEKEVVPAEIDQKQKGKEKEMMMEYVKPPGFVDPTQRRRIVTAPAPLQPVPQSQFVGSQSGNGLVETLYNHPSVKIIAFTAGPRTFSFSPGRDFSAPPEIEPGTLPWSSRIERTIAVGPFRIYRAPGSVAFLSCGSALQPILPKSQCWCIDEGSSKFVLQIRRPQYWRIEIPVDAERGQALRDVFDSVLLFEKTPCPFQRAFTVELPERPQTPVKKRPWTPVRKTSIQLPPTPVTPEDVVTPRPGLVARRRNSITKFSDRFSDKSSSDGSPLEDVQTPTLPVIERIRRMEASAAEESRSREGVQDDAKDKLDLSPTIEPGPLVIARQGPGFGASRCVTAPPQLSLVTPQPLSSTAQPAQPPACQSTETSVTNSPTNSSVDSFHSLQSWHSPITPLPPSPPLSNPNSPKTFPYPHENIALPYQESPGSVPISESPNVLSPTGATDGIRSSDELSPATDAADNEPPPSASSDEGSMKSFDEEVPLKQESPQPQQAPSTPVTATLISTTSPPATRPVTDPRPRLRHRATTSSISSVSHHRALSPLPPAANLITTPHRKFRTYASSNRAQTRLEAVRRIPGAIIHKTCEILLSPPGHLINLMLNVAARIAAGEWRGFVFGVGEGGERIPVHWDLSDNGSDAGSATSTTAASPWDVHDVPADDRWRRHERGSSSRSSSRHSVGSVVDDILGAPVLPDESPVSVGNDASWEVD